MTNTKTTEVNVASKVIDIFIRNETQILSSYLGLKNPKRKEIEFEVKFEGEYFHSSMFGFVELCERSKSDEDKIKLKISARSEDTQFYSYSGFYSIKTKRGKLTRKD